MLREDIGSYRIQSSSKYVVVYHNKHIIIKRAFESTYAREHYFRLMVDMATFITEK